MRLETIRKVPLCGIACQNIAEVIKENNLPEGILSNQRDYKVGEMMTNDKRVPLISATGSIRMGKIVAQTVAVVWEDHY
jgi:aldehyde dehydrogenase (NAD+)